MNWMPCRRHRFAADADRQQGEPARDWRQGIGSHENVINPLHAAAPTFFWGGHRRHGEDLGQVDA